MNTCFFCYKPLTRDCVEFHHDDGWAEGGATHEDNGVAVCPNCHRRHHHNEREALLPRASVAASAAFAASEAVSVADDDDDDDDDGEVIELDGKIE